MLLKSAICFVCSCFKYIRFADMFYECVLNAAEFFGKRFENENCLTRKNEGKWN